MLAPCKSNGSPPLRRTSPPSRAPLSWISPASSRPAWTSQVPPVLRSALVDTRPTPSDPHPTRFVPAWLHLTHQFAMDYFYSTYTDLLSSDTPIESIAMSVPVESSQSKPPKRTANFTQEEDVQLCMSWESVSSDPIIGNEQPGKAYWTRITEHFHAHKTFDSDRTDRTKNSLEHRWGTIQRECQIFQGAFEAMERRHPSGVPYQEHLLEAQLSYSGGKKKGFPLLHCWLKVRNSPKFQSLNPKEKKKATNAKKQKTSNATSSNPINLDEVEEEGMGSQHSPESGQRPIGRKRAKEQLKNKGGDGAYKKVIEELLLEKKEERKMNDLRWQEAKTIQERRI